MDSEGGMSLKAKPTNCGIVYRASKSIYFGVNDRAGSQSDLGWYDTAPCSGVTVLFVMTVE